MKPNFKFFDLDLRLKITKHKGLPIWDCESSFLRWMLEVGREGMLPLEVDIVRACIAERGRLHALYKKNQQEAEHKSQTDAKFYQAHGLSAEVPEGDLLDAFF